MCEPEIPLLVLVLLLLAEARAVAAGAAGLQCKRFLHGRAGKLRLGKAIAGAAGKGLAGEAGPFLCSGEKLGARRTASGAAA